MPLCWVSQHFFRLYLLLLQNHPDQILSFFVTYITFGRGIRWMGSGYIVCKFGFLRFYARTCVFFSVTTTSPLCPSQPSGRKCIHNLYLHYKYCLIRIHLSILKYTDVCIQDGIFYTVFERPNMYIFKSYSLSLFYPVLLLAEDRQWAWNYSSS